MPFGEEVCDVNKKTATLKSEFCIAKIVPVVPISVRFIEKYFSCTSFKLYVHFDRKETTDYKQLLSDQANSRVLSLNWT